MYNRKIHTWRDPYDAGFSTCRPKEITLNKGLTVLVGCNGAGKTTLLRNIREQLKKEEVPVLNFDNLKDGNSSSTFDTAMLKSDFSFIGASLCSSEGENITLNLGRLAVGIREFLETGITEQDKRAERWHEIFRDEDEKKKDKHISNERWILLDAIDSGYSIDNVIELKNLFDLILEDSERMGIDVYIVVSANEYELVSGEDCFNVMNGKYLRFKDYEDFKRFILGTRKKKDKREERIRNKKSGMENE